MRGEKVGTGNGTAIIEPNGEVIAATQDTWTIVYTVGEKGIVKGGGIRVEIPYGFSVPQLKDPNKAGYITVSVSSSLVRLSCLVPELGYEHQPEWKVTPATNDFYYVTRWGYHLFINLEEGDLKKGDTINIVYGDIAISPHGAALAQYFAQTVEFTIATNTDGQKQAPFSGYYLIENSPRLKVVGDKVSNLTISLPPTIKKGKHTAVKVVARDKYGNLSGHYTGTIDFNRNDVLVDLSDRYSFIQKDGGIHSFEVTFKKAGLVSHIDIKDEVNSIFARSNPAIVSKEDTDAENIYWGDIHGHTILSDGLGSLEEYYQFAWEIASLDFGATADHGQYMSDEDWEETKKAAARFNKPGEFVTFSGYEYSDNRPEVGFGDMCIYYPADDKPIYRITDICRRYYCHLPEVAEKIKENKGMIVLHQHAGGNKFYNPQVMRLAEIYSIWGASEYVHNPRPLLPEKEKGIDYRGLMVQDYLAKGFKIGIIAGSDCHAGHPGYTDWLRRRKAYHGGLTAVYARELNREAVWDALWNRRCYATTGARIILDFKVNGYLMGNDIIVERDNSRHIEVKVIGTNKIKSIDIIRNNVDIYTHQGKDAFEELKYIDKEDLSQVDPQRSTIFYYIRVTQEDGEMGWSSPIWIELR